MSKIFIMCSLLALTSLPTLTHARDDWNPGRPGDNRPGRPGDNGPGRPGDNRPGRPGDDRPGDNRPGRPGDNGPGRPGDNGPGRPGDQRPPTGRVVFTNAESFRVQKVIETTNTVRVNQPNVKAVKFTAIDNSVEIVEARLLLDNGREVYMDGVTGGLGQNRSITYTLNGPWGERVQSITVRAVSRSLLGSRPTLQVAVGTIQ